MKKPPPNDLGGGFVSQYSPAGAVGLCEGFWRGLWVCGWVWVLDPLDRICSNICSIGFVTFSLQKKSKNVLVGCVKSVTVFS